MKIFLLGILLLLGNFIHLTAQDSSTVTLPKPHQTKLLTFSYLIGSYSEGDALTYYHFSKKDFKGWYFPYSLSLQNVSVKAGNISTFSFVNSSPNFFVPGISAMRNISDNFWINLGVQIPMSAENVTDPYGKLLTHGIIGIAPVQEIFLIPRTTYGLIIGVGVFERFTNAYKYQNDVGLRVELGLKF